MMNVSPFEQVLQHGASVRDAHDAVAQAARQVAEAAASARPAPGPEAETEAASVHP